LGTTNGRTRAESPFENWPGTTQSSSEPMQRFRGSKRLSARSRSSTDHFYPCSGNSISHRSMRRKKGGDWSKWWNAGVLVDQDHVKIIAQGRKVLRTRKKLGGNGVRFSQVHFRGMGRKTRATTPRKNTGERKKKGSS